MSKKKIRVKNQHYIPQFLMKNFVDSENGFCVLKINTNEIIINKGTEAFACSNYLYDLNEEDLRHSLKELLYLFPVLENSIDFKEVNFTENYFSKIEGQVSNLFNRILIHDNLILSNKEKMLIILFLFDLSYRTLFFKTSVDKISAKTNEIVEMIGKNHNLPNDIIEESKSVTGTKAHVSHIFDLRSFIDFSTMILNNYEFCYGKNNTNLGFILSDNPSYQLSCGLNDFCFPISSKRSIILRVKQGRVKMVSSIPNHTFIMNLSKLDIIQYNLWNSKLSHMFIFGQKESLEYIKATVQFGSIEVK